MSRWVCWVGIYASTNLGWAVLSCSVPYSDTSVARLNMPQKLIGNNDWLDNYRLETHELCASISFSHMEWNSNCKCAPVFNNYAHWEATMRWSWIFYRTLVIHNFQFDIYIGWEFRWECSLTTPALTSKPIIKNGDTVAILDILQIERKYHAELTLLEYTWHDINFFSRY